MAPTKESDGMPTMNGNAPSSAFLEHLYSYPVVNDTVCTFKENPYGQKSIRLAGNYFEALKPLLRNLQGPYQYVSPYVHRADCIGDSTLSKVDNTFPVIKKPTGELFQNATEYAGLPMKLASSGRDYVFQTYRSECKKVGGSGLMATSKAALTTTLVITSDTLSWVSTCLGQKKEEAKEAVNEKANK